MKVLGIVGWVKGNNGTGNVFEVSDGDKTYLAVIYPDDSFNGVTKDFVTGSGKLNSSKEFHSPPSGTLSVENPNGWQRLYSEPISSDSEAETIELPVSVSLDGVLKIKLGGFSKIVNLFN